MSRPQSNMFAEVPGRWARKDLHILIKQESHETLLTRACRALVEGRDVDALRLFVGMIDKYGDGSASIYEGAAQAFRNLGYLNKARDIVEAGLRFFPGHSSLTYIRSLLLLGQGDYREGWPGYEQRLKTRQACYRPRRLNFPRWHGEPLAGKRLLLWGGPGFR